MVGSHQPAVYYKTGSNDSSLVSQLQPKESTKGLLEYLLVEAGAPMKLATDCVQISVYLLLGLSERCISGLLGC